jgi:hypothetical protein
MLAGTLFQFIPMLDAHKALTALKNRKLLSKKFEWITRIRDFRHSLLCAKRRYWHRRRSKGLAP